MKEFQYFIMLIGINCSGKSSIANKLLKQYKNAVVCSEYEATEKFRKKEKFFTRSEVLAFMKNESAKLLTEGKTVIYDAINLSFKQRKKDLKEINSIFDKISKTKAKYIPKAVYIDISISNAIMRNGIKLNRYNTEDIVKQYNILEYPSFEEGWEEIETIDNNEEIKELLRK